jgi:sterol desaturase/sphingolipid hydroxylase (fatty acid hydroxylase superfamily)
MDWFLHSLPAFCVVAALIAAERLLRAPKTDWAINLAAWAINVGAGATVVALIDSWNGPALIDSRDLPAWAAVPLSILVFDLMEYLYHRVQHRIPVLWAMHSLHHSDPEMSALTTQRHFWADAIFKTLTVWSLGAMLVTPSRTAVVIYGLLSLYNFFTHSRLPVNFGRCSWLLNAPAYHRRHHSRLPEHYDSNFAALFPLWDVLLGSYHRPDGFPPTGLDRRPRTAADLLLWPLRFGRG